MVFTDNVLVLLAHACAPEGDNTIDSADLTDINGVTFKVRAYAGNTATGMQVSAVLAEAQIGKGESTPTRQDINVETPFTNGGGAEEDSRQTSFTAVYVNATEKIEMSTSLSAGGIGDIKEACKFVTINDNTGTDRVIMISRDLVTPPVGFIGGQIINITNEVLT